MVGRQPILIALMGGECTGKSSLAQALAEQFDAIVVDEYLRTFVQQHHRAPRQDEQAQIMARQSEDEQRSCEQARTQGIGVVISDPSPAMTAIYSQLYFGDDSLLPSAVDQLHRPGSLTVWCDDDLPWTPDGNQRDGIDFRQAAHRFIAQLLESHELPALLVSGSIEQRAAQIVESLATLD